VNYGFTRFYTNILRIDIDTGRFQITIQGKCLIKFISNMKPHILRNPSIIGIKITVTPLILSISGTFLIIPVIINADCHYILLSIFNIRSQIETYSHRTIFMQADIFTIDIKISSLTDAFKFNKNFFVFAIGRQTEMLTIPHDCIRQLFYT